MPIRTPVWDIRREGRRRTNEEFDEGTSVAPEKIEYVDGILAGERRRLEVGSPGMEVVIPPQEVQDRWGVYKIAFARRAHDEEGLVEQLREWLAELRRVYPNGWAERFSLGSIEPHRRS